MIMEARRRLEAPEIGVLLYVTRVGEVPVQYPALGKETQRSAHLVQNSRRGAEVEPAAVVVNLAACRIVVLIRRNVIRVSKVASTIYSIRCPLASKKYKLCPYSKVKYSIIGVSVVVATASRALIFLDLGPPVHQLCCQIQPAGKSVMAVKAQTIAHGHVIVTIGLVLHRGRHCGIGHQTKLRPETVGRLLLNFLLRRGLLLGLLLLGGGPGLRGRVIIGRGVRLPHAGRWLQLSCAASTRCSRALPPSAAGAATAAAQSLGRSGRRQATISSRLF